MKYTINRKSKIPQTAKHIVEQGYSSYIDIVDDISYGVDVTNTFPISVLIDSIEYHSGKHIPYTPYYGYDDCIILIREQWNAVDDIVKDKIYNDFLKTLYPDELFYELLYGDDSKYEQIVNEHVTQTFNQLYLKEYEVKHFKERVDKTLNLVRGICINKRLVLCTNLIGLLNEYRDDILITTPRQPAFVTTITEHSTSVPIGLDNGLSFDRDNNNFSKVDKFRIGFKNEDIAKEFTERLILSPHRSRYPYDAGTLRGNNISINVCSDISDKMFHGLKSKSYGVFLSKRVKPLKNDVVGYVTIESSTLHLNGDEGAIDDVSAYIKDRAESINKYSQKWSLPNVEVEYRPIRFDYDFRKDKSIQLSNHQVDIMNHRPTNFCNVTVGNFIEHDMLRKKLERDFLVISYYKMVSYKIHVPITTGVDIDSYKKLLNYAKLTNMKVVSLMLLPHCVGDEYQNTFLDVLDKLVD